MKPKVSPFALEHKIQRLVKRYHATLSKKMREEVLNELYQPMHILCYRVILAYYTHHDTEVMEQAAHFAATDIIMRLWTKGLPKHRKSWVTYLRYYTKWYIMNERSPVYVEEPNMGERIEISAIEDSFRFRSDDYPDAAYERKAMLVKLVRDTRQFMRIKSPINADVSDLLAVLFLINIGNERANFYEFTKHGISLQLLKVAYDAYIKGKARKVFANQDMTI